MPWEYCTRIQQVPQICEWRHQSCSGGLTHPRDMKGTEHERADGFSSDLKTVAGSAWHNCGIIFRLCPFSMTQLLSLLLPTKFRFTLSCNPFHLLTTSINWWQDPPRGSWSSIQLYLKTIGIVQWPQRSWDVLKGEERGKSADGSTF